MGRWELIKDWPEVSFAPYVGQKLYVGQCVCVCISICWYVCWGDSQCTLYSGPALVLITSTN